MPANYKGEGLKGKRVGGWRGFGPKVQRLLCHSRRGTGIAMAMAPSPSAICPLLPLWHSILWTLGPTPSTLEPFPLSLQAPQVCSHHSPLDCRCCATTAHPPVTVSKSAWHGHQLCTFWKCSLYLEDLLVASGSSSCSITPYLLFLSNLPWS